MDRESPFGTTRLAPNEKSLLTFTAVAHATSDALHVLYPALLFLMAADFDEDYLFLGILAYAMVASRGIAGLSAGFLADRTSSRLLFGAFAGLSCLGCAVVALSSGRATVLVGLMLLGMGAGMYHPVGLSSITRYVARRSVGLGIHGLAGSVGASVLPVLAITLGVAFHWKTSYALAAILPASLLVLLPMVPAEFDRPRLSGRQERESRDVIRALLQRSMVALYGASALKEFAYIGSITFLTTAVALYAGLGEERVLGLSSTGLFLTAVIACGGLGSYLGGRLGERHGPGRVLVPAILLAASALAVLGLGHGPSLLVVAPLVTFFFAAIDPQIGDMLGRYLPAGIHGKGFAFQYGIAQVIGSSVGLLSGAIADAYGVRWVFPTMAGVLLCSLPVVRVFLWREPAWKRS